MICWIVGSASYVVNAQCEEFHRAGPHGTRSTAGGKVNGRATDGSAACMVDAHLEGSHRARPCGARTRLKARLHRWPSLVSSLETLCIKESMALQERERNIRDLPDFPMTQQLSLTTQVLRSTCWTSVVARLRATEILAVDFKDGQRCGRRFVHGSWINVRMGRLRAG